MSHLSILNDVIGPVFRGPSSSHCAGAYRIATIARSLLGKQPTKATLAFDPDGSYAPTYEICGVDLAVAAGLLGMEMTDSAFRDALDLARQAGMELAFDIRPLPDADHPNYVEVELTGDETLTIAAKSTGGGGVLITRVGDQNVELDGKSRAVVASRVAEPVFHEPVGESIFESAAEMIASAKQFGRSLAPTAAAYEAAVLGRELMWVSREILGRYHVMEASVAQGLAGRDLRMPLLKPSARSVMEAGNRGDLPVGGTHARAAARAMAVMHVDNSMGVVCAAPTGGSAGVIPGVLTTLAEEYESDDTSIADALLAAGAIGLIIAKRGTFAAETAGCQVEIGAAGAMAAAAISLQNCMGLVCDPVQGAARFPATRATRSRRRVPSSARISSWAATRIRSRSMRPSTPSCQSAE